MIATNLKNRVGAIAATVAISCALCVMLAGCATENSGNVTSDQDEYSAVEKATITTRTVTFPAALFKDESSEDVQSSLQEKGCTDTLPTMMVPIPRLCPLMRTTTSSIRGIRMWWTLLTECRTAKIGRQSQQSTTMTSFPTSR